MTTTSLRKSIKASVDKLPPQRLLTLAEFVAFLSRPPLMERIESAERARQKGHGRDWREVRKDV